MTTTRKCPSCDSDMHTAHVGCCWCGWCSHGYEATIFRVCDVCGRQRGAYNGPAWETAERIRQFYGAAPPSVGDLRLDNRARWGRGDHAGGDARDVDIQVSQLTIDPESFIPGPKSSGPMPGRIWRNSGIEALPGGFAGGYSPIQPLRVQWFSYTGGCIAWWPAMDMWATGRCGADAISHLQADIVEMCQDFDSGQRSPSEKWLQDRRKMRSLVRKTWNTLRDPDKHEGAADEPTEWLEREVKVWGNERVEVWAPFAVKSRTSCIGGSRVGEAAWTEPQIFVEAGDEQTALDKLMVVIERAFLGQRAPRDGTTAEMNRALNAHLRRGPCDVTGGAPIAAAKVPPAPTGKVACEPDVSLGMDECFAHDGDKPTDVKVDCSGGPVTINLPLSDGSVLFRCQGDTGEPRPTITSPWLTQVVTHLCDDIEVIEPLKIVVRRSANTFVAYWSQGDVFGCNVGGREAAVADLLHAIERLARELDEMDDWVGRDERRQVYSRHLRFRRKRDQDASPPA